MFCENISKGFRVTDLNSRVDADMICILNFTEGRNSVSTVDGVMVLVLCRFSDYGLYLS